MEATETWPMELFFYFTNFKNPPYIKTGAKNAPKSHCGEVVLSNPFALKKAGLCLSPINSL